MLVGGMLDRKMVNACLRVGRKPLCVFGWRLRTRVAEAEVVVIGGFGIGTRRHGNLTEVDLTQQPCLMSLGKRWHESRDRRVVLAKKMAKREAAAGWREPSGLAGARLVASARGLEKTGRRVAGGGGGGGGACGIGRLGSYGGGRWPARVAGAVSISREGRPDQSRAVTVAADTKWWSSRLVVLLAGARLGGQTRDERGPSSLQHCRRASQLYSVP